MSDGQDLIYFEDMTPGRKFVSPERRITAEDIVAFGRQFDPQTFHIDPQAASDTFFKAHVASGWHTTAFSMRLMVEAMPIADGVIGAGCEMIRWPRPVFPGDVLHLEITVGEGRVSANRPEIGIVSITVLGINQNGETVLEMTPKLVVPVRAH
ncbi:MaoC family dehydratase [Tepidamorphus sp. 3E244]|uniref:MaoC family dehydratase n=1 Tax=Tepidamorphus sp. 3E244 TaxID=3385498 RepID=UPI0038FD0BC0